LATTGISLAPHGTKPPTSGPVWVAVFLDNADQANALGYHGEGSGGLIFQRIFVQTSRQDGVPESSVFSHEAAEAAVDPTINRLADDGSGKAWALEVGDPVQRDSYTINIGAGGTVSVSNFANPELFDPTATENFDHLGLVTHPFGLSAGGYGQWTSDLTNWQQVGSDLYAGHDRPSRSHKRKELRVN
jgi:hypothetical protein